MLAFSEPWNADALADVDDYITAAELWAKWAGTPNLSFANLTPSIAGQQRIGVKGLLTAWLAGFTSKTDWIIRFTSGTATTSGYGTYRGLNVTSSFVDSTEQIQTNETASGFHDWAAPATHVYGPPSGPAMDVKFTWSPGQPISIAMVGPRFISTIGYRSYMLAPVPFTGPLAVWQANKEGRAANEISTLNFTIVGCPGPPPSW